MSEQNIKIVQNCYAAFGRGDIPGLLAELTDDSDWFFPGGSDVPFSGRYQGPAKVGEFFQKLDGFVTFEEFEPLQFISTGDTVVVLGRDKVTVKSTGKGVELDWVHVMTLRDGKVSAFKEFIDTARIAAAFR